MSESAPGIDRPIPPALVAVARPHDAAVVAATGERRRRPTRPLLLGLGFPLALVLLWDAAVRLTGTHLVPVPSGVAVMMYDFFLGGIYDDRFSAIGLAALLLSAGRVYAGFFLAAVAGIPLGLAIGRVAVVRELLDPTISVLRPIPVTAWLPLSMIFFGIGVRAAVFLVFLGGFYPILLNTLFGVRSIEPRLIEAAAMLGCRGAALFRQVILPAALPSIVNGLRLALGFAWVLIVVGETTGVKEGLGAVITDGRNLSRADVVITGMIVIGAMGFLSDRLMLAINKRVLRWSPQHG